MAHIVLTASQTDGQILKPGKEKKLNMYCTTVNKAIKRGLPEQILTILWPKTNVHSYVKSMI